MKHFYAGYFTAFAIMFGMALLDRNSVTDPYSYSTDDYRGGYDYSDAYSGGNDYDYGEYSAPYDFYLIEDEHGLIWT
jgi:hypothetical protein